MDKALLQYNEATMSKTYLVTGGAGFIGSNLVDVLIKQNNKVVILDDFSWGREENIEHLRDNELVTIHKGNIIDTLDDLFAQHNFDAVLNLAALPRVQYSIDSPVESHSANLNGVLNLLMAAKEHGVKRFVQYGSSSQYGNPESMPFKESMNMEPLAPYGLQKLAAVHYARLFHLLYGMETISLIPFNVYGPRQNPMSDYAVLIPRCALWALKGVSFQVYGDGEQTRDFTYVMDVVDATIKAATTTNKDAFGKMFNIGAGNRRSANDVVNEIIALAGKDIKPEHGPAKIEARDTEADISNTKKYLDWEPQHSFEDGIKQTFAWYKDKADTFT